MKYAIMDRTGHSEETYGADKVSINKAMERFNELTKKKGYIANVPGKDGAPGTHLRSFDPTVEEVDFYPTLIGG